jgi:hypothetical protein
LEGCCANDDDDHDDDDDDDDDYDDKSLQKQKSPTNAQKVYYLHS